LSKRKANCKNIAIVILDVILLAAVYLPNSSFNQVPTPQFISESHNNITNSNNTIIHANKNNKSLSSQGTNSYSYSLNNNKVPNTLKPKSSPSTSHTKIATTEVANVSQKGVDKFGIKEIYPTKKGGGREWYINMADPRNDSIFSTGFKQSLIKQNSSNSSSNYSSGSDNNNGSVGSTNSNSISWRITNPQVRMHVDTPPGSAQWKNVEITGYVKVNSTNITSAHHHQKDIPNHIAWLARSGVHTDSAPCNGTDLSGSIRDDGSVGWKKEIWFTRGYTNESAHAKPTDSIVGRWIGWKTVVYNINNDKAVKMESYLDDKNNNHWIRVTNFTDSGGWYADTSDKKFYSANCGKPKDYIITNSGPMIFFRADNMILDFKNLSVREIEPPLPTRNPLYLPH
jgi:hypothetical protein